MAGDDQKWNSGKWHADNSEGLDPEQPEHLPGTTNDKPRTSADPSLVAMLKRVPHLPLVLVGIAILAAIVIAIPIMKWPTATPSFQDLGAGISRATGLRGHLNVRWLGKPQYKLSFVPLDPLQSAGFSFVAGNPPQPLWIDIKLLDSTGFILCGKEILLPYDPASAVGLASSHPPPAGKRAGAKRLAASADLANRQAREQQSETGNDIFQTQIGDSGQVVALNAQGVLPCTADQYKRFSYWDFSTNFPTLAEQDTLMEQRAAAVARAAAEARAALRRKNAPKYRSAFFTEGDDRIGGYDSSSGMLRTGGGRSFLVTRASDQATANGWAANSALIHFKCDQYDDCSLTHSGGSEVIYAKSIR